ncbi:MAG TPA: hypothetical protein VIL09_11145 [Microvirga sp.]|jgi:uncharacterized membrane protein
MSRTGWLILGLVTLIAVLSMVMTSDPEHAAQLEQARRDAAFTGETRDMVLLMLALGIAGFIGYLTLSRR